MKKVGLLSLGCAKNLVDSEVMLGTLRRQGYALTAEAETADVVIVNTCGFIESAKEESIQAILDMAELKKQGQLQKLIVTGCLSQRYHSEMEKELPEVDAFLGINAPAQIAQLLKSDSPELPETWDPSYLYSAQDERVLATAKHSAYVKISEGCDHVCSFCIIPKLRGQHRSRTIEDIVREVEFLGANGVREINLVAQDSTYYGRDLGLKDGLAQLLERLDQVPNIAWVRVHYMYPYQVTPRLLEIMSAGKKICPYMDMPLQHADKSVLSAMKRGSGRHQLSQFLERIRKGFPQAFIRSSFIVGFPNEDQRAFDELCGFVQEQEFDYLGVFTYSLEEDTSAFPLEDPIDPSLKKERKETLLELQREISRKKLARLVGKTLDVLVEGAHPETDLLLRGRHAGQAPEVDGEVLITEGSYAPGEIIPITVEASYEYDIAGRVQGGFAV
ncbi:MAG: 30S ribosomal protein S12 methylthiotransferase RimO [Acidobacteria bacterium]|nr:30S ribosomal protein S12 methylthiotransferase RimO [Acidobacteriota bacterium]MCB9397851.1 30S ribosomal protein S12 methylthiotransferase RimO [Acidobacteriota bacterium]